jgi:hypothetical protein
MDNVQNCDSYINVPLSQTYRAYLQKLNFHLSRNFCFKKYICTMISYVINTKYTITVWCRKIPTLCSLPSAFIPFEFNEILSLLFYISWDTSMIFKDFTGSTIRSSKSVPANSTYSLSKGQRESISNESWGNTATAAYAPTTWTNASYETWTKQDKKDVLHCY